MKVIILRAFHVYDEEDKPVRYSPGQVVETTDETAALWIEHGHVKPAFENAPA